VRVRTLEITLLELPFRMSVKHATKRRVSCDSVLVRVESEDGVVGWGEGAPRPYVGGEDQASVLRELSEVVWPVLASRDVPNFDGDLRAFLKELDDFLPESPGDGEVVAHHAARCAVELALVDCQLRRAGVGLCDALGVARPRVKYNGMLPTGSPKAARFALGLMKNLEIQTVKVKVGDEGEAARIEMVREILGEEVRVLADVNGIWTETEAKAADERFRKLGVALMEQPLPRGPVSELAALRAATSIPIMTDESLVTLEDARSLIESEACDVFNVRLSKCGGLARSLEFIELARSGGLDWQLGAHVGETGILSAVGRALALSVTDSLFVEGSIGEWLLQEDLCVPPVQFGPDSYGEPLSGPGLGIEILEERVARYAVRTVRLGEQG
jgi:L-alanine-DL-glutamate epimerase-like enolase superfamily enzyme